MTDFPSDLYGRESGFEFFLLPAQITQTVSPLFTNYDSTVFNGKVKTLAADYADARGFSFSICEN